jgi:uncharacterized cupredoxin-like copper-binding protein
MLAVAVFLATLAVPAPVAPAVPVLAARGESFADRSGEETAEPPVIEIVAKDYAFELPGRLPDGAVTLRLLNHGKEFHHATIVRLEEGHTLADYLAAREADEPRPWVTALGGPQAVPPGGADEVTVELEPGRYAVACYIPGPDGVAHVAKGMAKEFVVEADDVAPAPMPDADGTVGLVDYAFAFMEPLHAGRQSVRVVNMGGTDHELVFFRLHEDKHLDDILAWTETLEGPPPADLAGGVAAMAPGEENVIDLDLQAGTYAAICFIPDAGDGKSHIEHGMKVEFEVE